MRDQSLNVAVVNVPETQTAQQRLRFPAQLGSCHTTKAGGYFVEGHIPADLVQRLLAEQPPNIRGLAVPGMSIGSPGMDWLNPIEHEVLGMNAQDALEVFATREGQHSLRCSWRVHSGSSASDMVVDQKKIPRAPSHRCVPAASNRANRRWPQKHD